MRWSSYAFWEAGLAEGALLCVGCGGADDTSLFGAGSDGGGTQWQDSTPGDVAPPKDVQPAEDVQPPPDSGPGKTPIHCGMGPSGTAPDEECCRQGAFQYTYACEVPGNCIGLSIPCDRAQNCASLGLPGTVCCGHYSAQSQQVYVDQVECKAAGQCTQQQSSVILCDPQDPNACPNPLTCQQSQVSMQGYFICRP